MKTSTKELLAHSESHKDGAVGLTLMTVEQGP